MIDIAVWKTLLGPTWLDLGNGFRNLFLLSCLLQASALGCLFARRGWFTKSSRLACFLTGAAVTPFAQYLWTLLLAGVFPQAPKLLYIGCLPALAAGYWLWLAVRYCRRLPALGRQAMAFLRRIVRLDKPALFSLCFALALGILLLPVCVRLSISMNAAHPGDSGEYMALATRFCEDRSLPELLEKEETLGHFRGNSHFPSLELYLSYGLMHTGGEYGYPNDKPMLTGVGILTFYLMAAYGALLLVVCRERKRWVLLGIVLLNLAPNLYESVNGAPRDLWRILALFLAALFFAGLGTEGNWKAYLKKLLAALIVSFTVMSAHVVCFVVLPFMVLAWVLTRWYAAVASGERKTLGALLKSAGIALSAAAGVLLGFAGNLWCYLRWGEMSPWRLMTTYTAAPWYEMYMAGEYKLEATTTTLNFWTSRYDILMAYATPIGLWGMRLALLTLALALAYLLWRRHSKTRILTAEGKLAPAGTKEGLCGAATLCYAALLTLCTLLPMTGLIDSKLYSFSGAFLALQRYTLQWFMLAGVMIAAALSALEGAWPKIQEWTRQKWGKLGAWVLRKPWGHGAATLYRTLPALLCALLCLLAFGEGVNQTGYRASFYRQSRQLMEDESALLDNGFLQRYGLLMAAARHVPKERKILLTRAGYQYPLKARGYILTANPIVPLMNLPLAEIPAALAAQGIAMLATEPKFWDERYFAKSTLSQYLSALPPEQILQDGDNMRLYILDPALAKAIAAEIAY